MKITYKTHTLSSGDLPLLKTLCERSGSLIQVLWDLDDEFFFWAKCPEKGDITSQFIEAFSLDELGAVIETLESLEGSWEFAGGPFMWLPYILRQSAEYAIKQATK